MTAPTWKQPTVEERNKLIERHSIQNENKPRMTSWRISQTERWAKETGHIKKRHYDSSLHKAEMQAKGTYGVGIEDMGHLGRRREYSWERLPGTFWPCSISSSNLCTSLFVCYSSTETLQKLGNAISHSAYLVTGQSVLAGVHTTCQPLGAPVVMRAPTGAARH